MTKRPPDEDLPSPSPTPASREVHEAFKSHKNLIERFTAAINKDGDQEIKNCLNNYPNSEERNLDIGVVIVEFLSDGKFTPENINKLFKGIISIFGEEFLGNLIKGFVTEKLLRGLDADEFNRILPFVKKYDPILSEFVPPPNPDDLMDNLQDKFIRGVEAKLFSIREISEFLQEQTRQMSERDFDAIFVKTIFDFVSERQHDKAENLVKGGTEALGVNWIAERFKFLEQIFEKIGNKNDFAEFQEKLSREISPHKRLKGTNEDKVRA